MVYACIACQKEITPEDITKRIRCIYCGAKLLFKKRPEVVKKVKAR